MKYFIIFLIALTSFLPHAHIKAEEINRYGDEYIQCQGHNTTIGIVNCVQELTKIWDIKLNEAYKNAITYDAFTEEQKQLLKDAQRVWIKYRDANCEFYYATPGTIKQITTAECMRVMTARRALEIEDMIRP